MKMHDAEGRNEVCSSAVLGADDGSQDAHRKNKTAAADGETNLQIC